MIEIAKWLNSCWLETTSRRLQREAAGRAGNNEVVTRPEQFRPVHQYAMLGGRPQEEELLDDELWNEQGVVYARIVQEEIIYIRSVDQRLCARIQEHLRIILTPRYAEYRKWAEGKRITTVAYKPPLIEVLGRLIPVHRALEAALIAEFHPRFVAQT